MSSDEEFFESEEEELPPTPTPPIKKLRLKRLSRGDITPSPPAQIAPSPVPSPVSTVVSAIPWKNPNWNKQKKKRTFRSLKQILSAEKVESLPPQIPTFKSIEVPHSFLPKQNYCDLTGLPALYTDPSSGLRYHNAEVYQYIQTLNVSQIQAFKRIKKDVIIK
ncbi:hypothetical protein P9112_007917 [Eukaryota sp. TZLM1-RC]